MSDIVARAKAALESVTDGPWVVNREGWACISSGSDSVFHGYFEGSCGDCGDEIHDAASVAISIEDAEFIAAARTLVPELVAEVEKLRAVIIDRAVADHRQQLMASARVKPVPVEGRVWLYRSDADGAEVLVRFDGGEWQTADPGLPGRWYSDDGRLLEWPGVFVELEEGLPR